MPDDREAAGVATAILIGDRAGLSDQVERRLQRAGTYHVIAISGGNIALFAALAWAFARACVGARRPAILAAMIVVTAYGLLVGTGASVGRAVASGRGGQRVDGSESIGRGILRACGDGSGLGRPSHASSFWNRSKTAA